MTNCSSDLSSQNTGERCQAKLSACNIAEATQGACIHQCLLLLNLSAACFASREKLACPAPKLYVHKCHTAIDCPACRYLENVPSIVPLLEKEYRIAAKRLEDTQEELNDLHPEK